MTIIKYLILGLLAFVALKVALGIAGVVLGLGLLAAVTVGPILLVGWGVSKLLGHKRQAPQISEEDRRWLES